MKKFLSILLTLSMCIMSCGVSAERVVSDWAKPEVEKAQSLDLVPEGIVSADLTQDITRDEFAAISVKLYEYFIGEKVSAPEVNPFTDTNDEYVTKAYAVGITTGTSATEFDPKAKLTREQAATMLCRVYKKVTIDGWTLATDADVKLSFTKDQKFADNALISEYALDSIYFMNANGIINGVGEGNFDPQGSASREQAIAIAVRMAASDLVKKTEEGDAEATTAPEATAAPTAEPTPEPVDDKFNIAFIGGSLTEGGAVWLNRLKSIMSEHTGKEVVIENAGKGGTCSDLGAARFSVDIAPYKPDMVVVEFAVNDRFMGEETKAYNESIIRQCLALEKVPYVLFIYAPFPVEKTNEIYSGWSRGVSLKQDLAKYYGIKSINIYDYMQRDYNAIRATEGFATFTEYLSTLYPASGEGFDVHGGYMKYADAIEEAFSQNIESCLTVPASKNVISTKYADIVNATYSQIPVSQMEFDDNWTIYNKDKQFSSGATGENIVNKFYSYPYFPEGVAVTKAAGTVTFKTSANAISLSMCSGSNGNTAKVSIDGKPAGEFTCYSQYENVNYMDKWIEIKTPGEHTVTLTVDAPSGNKTIFKFGSIIERFKN